MAIQEKRPQYRRKFSCEYEKAKWGFIARKRFEERGP